MSHQYDIAGRRTRATWPDAFYDDYLYNTLGEMTQVRENGASSGAGVLATFGYNQIGQRTNISRAGGADGVGVASTPFPGMPLHHTGIVPAPLDPTLAAEISAVFTTIDNPVRCR